VGFCVSRMAGYVTFSNPPFTDRDLARPPANPYKQENLTRTSTYIADCYQSSASRQTRWISRNWRVVVAAAAAAGPLG
jgi:hypothetical protein